MPTASRNSRNKVPQKLELAYPNAEPENMAVSVVCLSDVAKIARRKLGLHAYSYFASGADEEQTLRDNEEAFKRCVLNHVPR